MAHPAPDPAREAPRLLLVTTPDAGTAERLARLLLERRLAACCNLIPGITSLYRWEGRVETSAEHLILVKTVVAHVRAIQALLATEHPYDCPECIALEPSSVEARYLAWWLAGVEGGA